MSRQFSKFSVLSRLAIVALTLIAFGAILAACSPTAPAPAATAAPTVVPQPTKPPAPTAAPWAPPAAADRFAAARQRCVDETNAYRARVGVPPVVARPDTAACTDTDARGEPLPDELVGVGITEKLADQVPLELRGEDARDRAEELLGRVGLGDRGHHYPAQLSGGEQQRVAVARAFAHRPKILFADEPTGNLDAATGAGIIDLIFRLNAEQGTTLVLVTHDEMLARRCTRQIRLAGGRVEGG